MEIIISEIRAYPITFNFEELKTGIINKLETYKGLVYDDAQIKTAKADRAKLATFRDTLESKRKEIKAQQAEPYMDFEAKIKELVALINEPLDEIDSQIKKFENAKKDQKRAEIEAFWLTLTDESEINRVEIGRIFNERWLNVTYKSEDVMKELTDLADRLKSEFDVLNTKTEFKDELISKFFETLELGKVLQHELVLQNEKKRREQVQVQTQTQPQEKVFHRNVAPAEQPQQAAEVPTVENTFGTETLKLQFVVNSFQKEKLRDCIREYEIPCSVIN